MFDIFSAKPKIIVQGATGHEGSRAIKFMLNYGTEVCAGVTPGKGGQSVEGVQIYNSVREACQKIGPVDMTSLYVPPFASLSAVNEAIAAGIKFIHILTEGIPFQDLAQIIENCQKHQVTLLGPGSLGFLITDHFRVGMLGGQNPTDIYQPGNISIISRSGGMTNEIANLFHQNKLGIRLAISLGSEQISGISMSEMVKYLDADSGTKKIAIFEEITHNDLEELASYVQSRKTGKQIMLSYVGQKTLDKMPSNTSFGHADNIVKKNRNEDQNIAKLKKAGIQIVDSYEDFIK